MRVWAVVALALFLLLPMVVLGPSAPLAPVQDPVAARKDGPLPGLRAPRVEPDFRDAVYGDLLVVGNSVLRCPEGDEACRAATDNAAAPDAGANNNAYAMRLAAGPDSFAASSAELTIPAGARVRYAQLNWGGHTGSFLGFSGVNCVRPLGAPSAAPPGSPDRQDVRLAVAGGPAVAVPRTPEHFRLTSGLVEPSQLYTDWADVTDRFAAAPAGRSVPIEVRDVWAPAGPGCAGGWSLVVVFDFGQPTAEYPTPRVVDVYSGPLPKGGALVPGLLEPLVPGFPSAIDALLPDLVPNLGGTHVVLAGPSPARGDVTLGLTAFDGDWRQGGETFAVDGEPVVEPCGREGVADFFRSCADGAVDGDHRPGNNMSVDAKTVRLSLPPNDTGDVDIGIDGTDDYVVLQSVALSAPVDPGIGLTVTGPATPVREGDLVELAVDITNTGSLPLHDIALSGADRCTPAVFAPLAPHASTTATCVVTAVAGQTTHALTVTGTYLESSGGDGRTVRATAADDTVVLPAEYAVSRVPDRLTAHAGTPVTFAVALRNNTDGDLTGLTYTDSATADCAPAPPVLAARTTATLECTVPAVTGTFASEGVLTGTDATGTAISVRSQQVTVVVIDPTITVTQTVAPDAVYRGQPVEAAYTVTHSGRQEDGPLVDVHVTTNLPGCAVDPVPALAPGDSVTVPCTGTPESTMDATVAVTASDAAGAAVTATADPVPLTVLAPLVAVTQSADPAAVRTGRPVRFTFTVTHVGTAADGPVRDVQVTSPTLPPSCVLAVVPTLAPGESVTRTCAAAPDRSFTNTASVSAIDGADRAMTADAEPLPVTVLNPALLVTVAATPTEARHGAEVDFEVVVHNTGNVDLAVAVTNDRARDCDLTLPALQAGSAQGVRCTVSMPAAESTTRFTDTASYEATPADGDPLTGTDSASVTLLAGLAPEEPAPGVDPADPSASASESAPSPGRNTNDANKNSDKDSDNASDGLAHTGAAVLVPLATGAALLLLGTAAVVATRRRRRT
ncbi:hypothetical protein [Actinophytocola sp.]|uniref:hypothetical protein n=1 Tax=Actinophytocola sp. TaxID=1872138 RepID=UPI00389A9261